VISKSLWLAEGVTSYYDRLLVRRAGLCSVDEYLEGSPPGGASDSDKSRNDIEVLQDTPGRLVHRSNRPRSTPGSSFTAATRHAQHRHQLLHQGAVVGFLLDARVRKATNGSKSLDDVMRLAYDRYSGPVGYTPQQFRATAAKSPAPTFALVREGARNDRGARLHRGLAWYGLRFKPAEDEKDKGKKPPKAWLGLTTKPTTAGCS